jgi:hypothetical protein
MKVALKKPKSSLKVNHLNQKRKIKAWKISIRCQWLPLLQLIEVCLWKTKSLLRRSLIWKNKIWLYSLARRGSLRVCFNLLMIHLDVTGCKESSPVDLKRRKIIDPSLDHPSSITIKRESLNDNASR